MLNLYFGNWFAVSTTILVLGVLLFIFQSYSKRNTISKWGRRIGLLLLVGTGISGLSATRDAYMTANALFSVSSLQSNLCSITGGAIFLTAMLSLFLKKQNHRKACFFLISLLFIIQVLVIELSRILIGGPL